MGTKGVLLRLLLVAGLVGVVAGACVLVSRGDEPPPEARKEEVRIIYVVESSWFATDPTKVRDSLEQSARHMASCADSEARTCHVMMFAVQGGDVAAKRVPSTRGERWFSLDLDTETGTEELRHDLVVDRIDEFVRAVDAEIVPESYEDQPKGCVNFVGNVARAFDELKRHPGDRNIVVVLSTAISNCQGQPFYPDRPFPPLEEAVDGVLADIPEGAAVLGDRHPPVCFDWTPMFGVAWREADVFVSQEQRQVLQQAWMQILDRWGATSGNRPGEEIGDCLTMEGAAR